MIPATEPAVGRRRPARQSYDSTVQLPRPRKAAAEPRPIPAMPDFAAMSGPEAVAAMDQVIALVKPARRKAEAPAHQAELLHAGWRILVAGRGSRAFDGLPDDAAFDEIDGRSHATMHALAQRLMRMKATGPEHLRAKRSVVEWLVARGNGMTDPDDDDALLQLLAEAIPTPTGDDGKLLKLAKDFLAQQHVIDAIMDGPASRETSVRADEASDAATAMAEKAARLRATTPAGIRAKLAILLEGVRGRVDQVKPYVADDDLAFSILRDLVRTADPPLAIPSQTGADGSSS